MADDAVIPDADTRESEGLAATLAARRIPNWRLVLEYDGTDFAGWQRQPGAVRTVQGVLERAFAQISGDAVAAIGAGRTDAGVHAEAQLVSVRATTRLDPATLQRALNALLPCDVAVRSVDPAPDCFHARRSARSKLYEYRLWAHPLRSPLRERFACWVREPLDLAAAQEASSLLVGTHDFASFCGAGGSARTTIRTISRAAWRGAAPGLVSFEVEGPGFLRHMVRNLVGSLLEVARGRRPPGWIRELLAVRDRTRAGPTAPARGLTLVRVDDGFPVGIQHLGHRPG
ncbi:tRNA pseudouridine(38-40) synthase TruA [Myxococcota bacterium]|nr:tRNA pseudouridine(38-40) synthase TruA [Myxococcota bacterium]MCZ7619415.1 tRNA pseudouridine(38-40) synthase TruA [Myxococcota bacterium]